MELADARDSLTGTGEFIQNVPLLIRTQEGLMFVLSVEVYESLAQFTEGPRRGRGSSDPGAAPTGDLNFPPEQEEGAFFQFEAQFLDSSSKFRRRGKVKDAFDRGPISAGPDGVRRGSAAK
jgi:hypothetical protein